MTRFFQHSTAFVVYRQEVYFRGAKEDLFIVGVGANMPPRQVERAARALMPQFAGNRDDAFVIGTVPGTVRKIVLDALTGYGVIAWFDPEKEYFVVCEAAESRDEGAYRKGDAIHPDELVLD